MTWVNSLEHVLFPFAWWQHDHAQTPLPCETSMPRAWAVATARRPWAGLTLWLTSDLSRQFSAIWRIFCRWKSHLQTVNAIAFAYPESPSLAVGSVSLVITTSGVGRHFVPHSKVASLDRTAEMTQCMTKVQSRCTSVIQRLRTPA